MGSGLRRRSRLRLSGTRCFGDRVLARPVAFAFALIIAWWAVTLLLATVLARLSHEQGG
jgi:hypothetical protein